MTEDRKKTIKISELTHSKLEDVKQEHDLKSFDEVISTLLGDHEREHVSVSLESGHNISPEQYESIRVNSRIILKFRNLKNFDKKVAIAALLHRSVVNSLAYLAMADHYDLKDYVTAVEQGQVDVKDQAEKIKNEQEKAKRLADKLMELNA